MTLRSRLALIVSACAVSLSLLLAPAVLAQGQKDMMGKDDMMTKDKMKAKGMKKDAMDKQNKMPKKMDETMK